MTDGRLSELAVVLSGLSPSSPSQETALLAARAIVAEMLAAQTAPDTRKSIATMMSEVAALRPLVSKRYTHVRSGDDYTLLMGAFDEHTNEQMAVYGMCAVPALKFVRPMSAFLRRFEKPSG